MKDSLEDMLNLEAEMQEIAGTSEDCMIGLAAFANKQAPTFVGQ
jgi:hypothetical protein